VNARLLGFLVVAAAACRSVAGMSPGRDGEADAPPVMSVRGAPGDALVPSPSVADTLAGTSGALVLSEGDVDFGAPALCAEAPMRVVSVTNDGPTTTGAVVVASAAPFRVVDDRCSGFELAAHAWCQLTVGYQPTADGEADDGTVAVSADPGGQVQLTVHGKAHFPDGLFVVSPAGHPETGVAEFGSVLVGGAKMAAITVKNDNPFPAALLGVGVVGADAASFRITQSTCGTRLGAGASCDLTVTFTPGGATPYTAALVVRTPCGTGNLVLQGQGS
jgi:hypothetical protein